MQAQQKCTYRSVFYLIYPIPVQAVWPGSDLFLWARFSSSAGLKIK
jgi:hypothetical protein